MSTTTLRQLVRLILTTNFSNRRIAKITGVSPNTVKNYRSKCHDKHIKLLDMNDMADNQFTRCLSNPKKTDTGKRLPDWPYVHELMQVKHQTLIQLWEEYRSICPADAYSYSQFTHYYRLYVKTIDISMRQYYQPGEVCFVDFAGKRIPWIDSDTSEEHFAEIFVGVLGCSQLIYACALRSQKLEDWLNAHQTMLAYYGGVPQLVVPDNLKSAVTTPGKFPVINHSYQELAEHYNFTIEPARVRRPQDKSLGEIGVLLVTRWITVILRRRTFFSIAEINQAIAELLEPLNQRPFKRVQGNRRERFESLEASCLAPLPKGTLEIGRWIHQQKVNRDYHVYVHGHAYSVPYELVGQHVDVKVCHQKIEFYFQHKLVTFHARSFVDGGTTTDNNHRPSSHQAYAKQSKAHFVEWAKQLGESALSLVMAQFYGRPEYSLKGCKACTQLQKLALQYGNQRFESACYCACEIQSMTVSSVRSILQHLTICLSRLSCLFIIMCAVLIITSMEVSKMSEQQVYTNLQELRLQGMASALQQVQESPDKLAMPLMDILSFLTCEEIQYKAQKKRERMFKAAKLKQGQACVEDIDYIAKRGIDKGNLVTLCTCDWVTRKQFLIITGSTGTGKSWLACALANQTIRLGLPALYQRFSLLMEELTTARKDGSLPKLRNYLAKFKLLIVDDWAMAPLSAGNRQDLLDLLEDRTGSGALIITTQLPVSKWHEYIGEPTIADAIMDRIIHRAHRLELHGESMRKIHSPLQTGGSHAKQ
jgi:DNA replication protein DnaC/transposase